MICSDCHIGTPWTSNALDDPINRGAGAVPVPTIVLWISAIVRQPRPSVAAQFQSELTLLVAQADRNKGPIKSRVLLAALILLTDKGEKTVGGQISAIRLAVRTDQERRSANP